MEHSRGDPESKQWEPTTVREGLPKPCQGNTKLCVCRGVTCKEGVTSRWGEIQASLAFCHSGDPREAEPWPRTSSLQQPGRGSWKGA